MDNVDFKSLTNDYKMMVCGIFTTDELTKAIWQCTGSKSPGPYDFNFNFIKNNQESIKQDITEVVDSFQSSRTFPKVVTLLS